MEKGCGCLAMLLVFVVIGYVVCGLDWRKKQIQEARQEGYNSAYQTEYDRVYAQYVPKIKQQKQNYEKKLKNQAIKFEKDKVVAKTNGTMDGKKTTLSEKTEQIQSKSDTAIKRGKWDSVVYEVKE